MKINNFLKIITRPIMPFLNILTAPVEKPKKNVYVPYANIARVDSKLFFKVAP